MMRTWTLKVLSLGTLLAGFGCDTEGEALFDDASLDSDEPVAYRCAGQGCLQSPHVGTFNIANLSEDRTPTISPDGSTTVQWTGVTKNGLPYAELRVTDEARCEVRESSSATWESCASTVLDLSITRGGQVTTAMLEIIHETILSGGPLTIYKYEIKAHLDPLLGGPSSFPHLICPDTGDEGTHKVVMLPDVQASWVVTNGDDGLSELVASTSNRFTLACDGYAEAKGYVRGKVLPNTGGARNYGVANYNGFTNAMRALFRKPGTTDEYRALTQDGTYVVIKDLINYPPLFNEIYRSAPPVGYGRYLLESVYNGNASVARKGASCKVSYVDVPCSGNGQDKYPDGIHRRAEFSPPMVEIPGWSDLPDCDMNHLYRFGSVGVYEWYQGRCLSPE